MAQLVVLEDYRVMALKDSVKLTDKLREQLGKTQIQDVPTEMWDIPTSLILNIEIPWIAVHNRPFKNMAADYWPQTTSDKDYVFVYPRYVIKDDVVPYAIQATGLQILRDSKEPIYAKRVQGSDSGFELVDKDGNIVGCRYVTAGGANAQKIVMIDDVLGVEHQDYEQARIANIKYQKGVPPSQIPRDYLNLSLLAQSFYSVRSTKENIFLHELKHYKNCLLTWPRAHSDEVAKISGVDCYHHLMDDEISAKIAEAIDAVNQYVRGGRPNSLSVFENAVWLQSWLHEVPVDRRMSAVMNVGDVARRTYDWWMTRMYSVYSTDFGKKLEMVIRGNVPARKLCMESDGVEYEKWRHMMFCYSVYNPETGHYVHMDLSQYLPHYTLTKSERNMVESVTRGVMEYNNRIVLSYGPSVQAGLLQQALELRSAALGQSEYQNQINNFQHSGLSLSAALDVCAGMTIVDETVERLGEKPQAKKQEVDPYAPFTLTDDTPPVYKKGRFLSAVSGMIDSAKKWFVKKSDFQHD